MRLVLRVSTAWLEWWRAYAARLALRRESSQFAIRRWMCQQPVIRPTPLRLVRGSGALTSSRLTGKCGQNGNGDAA